MFFSRAFYLSVLLLRFTKLAIRHIHENALCPPKIIQNHRAATIALPQFFPASEVPSRRALHDLS